MTRICAGLFLVGVIFLGADPPSVQGAQARRPAAAPASYFVKTAASLADVERTLQGKGAHGADLLKPGPTALEIVLRHEERADVGKHV